MQLSDDKGGLSGDPQVSGLPFASSGSSRYETYDLGRWLQKLYWNNPAFSVTTNFDHIKTHYYWSHTSVGGFWTYSLFLVLTADVFLY